MVSKPEPKLRTAGLLDSESRRLRWKSMDHRRKFDFKFKETVLQYAEKTSGEQAARFFNIDSKRIRDWRKKRAELLMSDQRRARLTGAGRKTVSPELEKRLSQWVHSMRDKQKRVSRKMIRAKALEIYPLVNDGGKTFVASRGWLKGFLRRNDLLHQGIKRTDQRDQNHPTMALGEQSDIALSTNDLKNIIVKEEQQEWSTGMEQEPQHIKEEQEELWSIQDGEQLHGLEEAETIKFPFAPVTVENENNEVKPQIAQVHLKQTAPIVPEADDENCESARGPDPEKHPQSGPEVRTEDSSELETDSSDDDWMETAEHQSASQCKLGMKTLQEASVKNKKQEKFLSGPANGITWECKCETDQPKGSRNTPRLRNDSFSPSAVEKQLLDIIKPPLTTPSSHVPSQGEEMFYFALSLVPSLNRLSREMQTQAQIHILSYLAGLEAQEKGQLPPQHPLVFQSSNQQQLNPQPAFHNFHSTHVYHQDQPTEVSTRAGQQGS